MIFRIIVLGLLLLTPTFSYAGFGAQTALELAIQEKINSLLRPIDPKALVVVNVRFKKLNVNLPGTSSVLNEMFAPDKADLVNSDEIEKIQVRVISRLDPFPTSLKSAVEGSLSIGSSKIVFSFQSMKPDLKDSLRQTDTDLRGWMEPLIKEMMDTFKSTGSALLFLLKVFLASFCVFMGAGWVWDYSRGKNQRNMIAGAVARVSESLEYSGNERMAMPVLPQASENMGPQAALTYRSDTGSGSGEFSQLSQASLLALISDCYWCEEDNYAAWIWNQLSPEQRQGVLRDWMPGLEYSAHLVRLKPVPQKDHLHSCYLSPLNLSTVGQKDLADWVRRYPEAWHALSPLRQKHLQMTLQEKMRFSQTKRSFELPAAPSTTSQTRDFGAVLEIGTLSEQDELSIFENPSFVPSEIRSQIHSLVWLALLEDAQRSAILENIPAQNLAEAWIAAPPVLEKIRAVLPEKKMKLIEGYSKVTPASRHSNSMRVMTQMALQVLENPEAQDEYSMSA